MSLTHLLPGIPARDPFEPDPIRIGLIDDHAVTRAGLRQLLHHETDLRVVWDAPDARDVPKHLLAHGVQVLVLDLMMPGVHALDVMVGIRAEAAHIPVLIYSGYGEEHYAAAMLREGARGFISKSDDPRNLVDAIRTVHGGKRYLQPVVAELLARRVMGDNRESSHQRLSSREFQVFLKLAQGCAPHETATALSLSPKAVSTYRARVLDKLGLHSNAEMTRYAVTHRLIF